MAGDEAKEAVIMKCEKCEKFKDVVSDTAGETGGVTVATAEVGGGSCGGVTVTAPSKANASSKRSRGGLRGSGGLDGRGDESLEAEPPPAPRTLPLQHPPALPLPSPDEEARRRHLREWRGVDVQRLRERRGDDNEDQVGPFVVLDGETEGFATGRSGTRRGRGDESHLDTMGTDFHAHDEDGRGEADATGSRNEEQTRLALEELRLQRVAAAADKERARKADDAWHSSLDASDRESVETATIIRATRLLIGFYEKHDPERADYNKLRELLETRLAFDSDWRHWADALCLSEHGESPGISSLTWRMEPP